MAYVYGFVFCFNSWCKFMGYDLCVVLFLSLCIFVFVVEIYELVFMGIVIMLNFGDYVVLIWIIEVMVVKYLFYFVLVFCFDIFCFGYGFKCVIILLLLSLLNVHVVFIVSFFFLNNSFLVFVFHFDLMLCVNDKNVCDIRLIMMGKDMWILVVQMGWEWYVSIDGIAMILHEKNEILMASGYGKRNERL